MSSTDTRATPVSTDDPAWRPATYFEHFDLATRVQATVKGEARRRTAKALIARGELDAIDDQLVAPALDEEDRAAAGRVHPLLMGGEYLPDYAPREVEIARVALESTTGDVISVRAKRAGGRIHYRICDEYGTYFKCRPQTSRRPLTLAQLIRPLENAIEGGITVAFLDSNYSADSGADYLRGFVTVSSAFYPGLEPYYAARIEEWFAKQEAAEAAANA